MGKNSDVLISSTDINVAVQDGGALTQTTATMVGSVARAFFLVLVFKLVLFFHVHCNKSLVICFIIMTNGHRQTYITHHSPLELGHSTFCLQSLAALQVHL